MPMKGRGIGGSGAMMAEAPLDLEFKLLELGS